MVLHGDGPAAAWAAAAQPGSRIEGIGPRGKVTVDPDADWHLFAGDDSALPASLAMAASSSTVTPASPTGPSWCSRSTGPTTSSGPRRPTGARCPCAGCTGPEATRPRGHSWWPPWPPCRFPRARGHAYLAGELGVVAAMRQALLARGMEADQISAKPYWRAGRANAAHGEPERPVASRRLPGTSRGAGGRRGVRPPAPVVGPEAQIARRAALPVDQVLQKRIDGGRRKRWTSNLGLAGPAKCVTPR